MGCGTMCGMVMGLLKLVAGASLLAAGMGMLAVPTALMVAGALMVLCAIGKLVHKMGMCPMCKDAQGCCK